MGERVRIDPHRVLGARVAAHLLAREVVDHAERAAHRDLPSGIARQTGDRGRVARRAKLHPDAPVKVRPRKHARHALVQLLLALRVKRIKRGHVAVQHQRELEHHAQHDNARQAAKVVAKAATRRAVDEHTTRGEPLAVQSRVLAKQEWGGRARVRWQAPARRIGRVDRRVVVRRMAAAVSAVAPLATVQRRARLGRRRAAGQHRGGLRRRRAACGGGAAI
eukprot:1384892-Prymnesium_polylepis.1